MPDRSRKPRPRDPNQLAKLVIDIATGQVEDTTPPLLAPDPDKPRMRLSGAAGSVLRDTTQNRP
jgi:hypothetical protein